MNNLNKVQKKALENAEKYFNNTLIVKYNLEPLDITKGINWDYQSKNNARTYQVYLHSLNFISDLLTAGIIMENNKYIKEAKKIIMNWYTSDSSFNQKWNEHAVSTRIKNIINFQESEHSFKIPKKIFNKIVIEHCDFLSDEDNYKRNNHGLMMDSALIYSSSVLENNNFKKVYLEKAMYRIRYAFYRDFSRKGVHLENSPEYHKLVIILYRKIIAGLKRHNLKIDKELKLIIENAKVFNQYMIKPNLTYPMIGDTGLIEEKSIKKLFKDFIDYEAGIVVLNDKREKDSTQSSYLTFKSGYQSKTHKHYDDLSITYYNFGKDILIDPGKYSYNKSDAIREFIISPEAHNTISIKNKKYELKNPLTDQQKLKITRFIKNKESKIITGVNNLYPGTSLSRHTIFTRDDILFLIDGANSSSDEIFQQNFNFNKGAEIKIINNLKYSIFIDGIGYILETFPIRKQTITSSIKKSYYSEKFSKVIKNERIVFETKAKRTIFATTLYRADKADITNVTLLNNHLNFKNIDQIVDIKL